MQLLQEQVVADTAATAALKETYLQQERKLEDLQGTVAARGFQIQEFEEQLSEKKMKRQDTVTAQGLQIHEMVEKVREKKAQQQEEVTSDPSSATVAEGAAVGTKFQKAMVRGHAVVDGCMLYFLSLFKCTIHSYDSERKVWSTVPECPRYNCSLAIVNGLLTIIGGSFDKFIRRRYLKQYKHIYTNTLLSLIVKDKETDGEWCEQLHPMPTKRAETAAVCTGKALVVAGGKNASGLKIAVEVMDTDTLQWSTASSLLFPLYGASATVCGDCLYLMGNNTRIGIWTDLVQTCSLSNLVQSYQPHAQSLIARMKSAFTRRETAWQRVADVPVIHTTCVAFNGRLLAVGGVISVLQPTNNIYALNLTTNSWEVTGHMPTVRSRCLVAVLPDNKLMVVGGEKKHILEPTNAVEIVDINNFHLH